MKNGKPEYDLLIYVANWPEARIHSWNSLLVARAIENQCYVAGLNRVGEDGMGIIYSGSSRIIDPKGEVITETHPGVSKVLEGSISAMELGSMREKFQVGLDWDLFSVDGDIST
jgi:predicted amidohydrolase